MKKFSFFFLIYVSSTTNLIASFLDNDEKLETVEKDLRPNNSNLFYNQGAFPYEISNSKESVRTICCEKDFVHHLYHMPEEQKLLSNNNLFQDYHLQVTDDDRCQIISESLSLNHEEVILRRVRVGIDGRKRVNNTDTWPYSIHGHLILTFDNGESYIGSGVLIGPHHVLTAGHNIYSHKPGEGWASNVIFVPAQNEELKPFGQAQGTILLSLNKWVLNKDKSYDMGMIILDQSIGYRTGWSGIISISNNIIQNQKIHVTGYPGDKGQSHFKGTQMWTMDHTVKSHTDEEISYDIDTYPGQSGSAVWTELKDIRGQPVIAIHAYGESIYSNNEGNSGTRISYPKFNCILNWLKSYQLQDFFHPHFSSLKHSNIIKSYYKGVPRKTPLSIQNDIKLHLKARDVKGSQYEKKTLFQRVLGRNEDSQIQRLQEQGMEVSVDLSTGANFNRLANMVDERDRVINLLSNVGTALVIELNENEKLITIENENYEQENEIFRQYNELKSQSIQNKDSIILQFQNNHESYKLSLIRIIQKLSQVPFQFENDKNLGHLLTILENQLNSFLEKK
ncbi:MAG: hypothetical protein BGO77_00460 [Caedibacter sp. 37-49]|nr:MAG: hypothetical protein BGO77_00460 [Caedibacter sp. 37-49]